jgi:O-antigen ligase
MLLSYAVVALILVFFDRSRSFKVMAFVSWCVFAGMIFLAASRSTSLLVALLTLCSALFMVLRSPSVVRGLFFIGVIVAGFVLLNYYDTSIESRLRHFSKELSVSQSDKFTTSSGFRFMLWKSGLSSVKYNMLTGSGYDLANSIESYEPKSEGEVKSINILKKRFGSYHNIWVDVLVSQGVVGFAILLSFFIVTLSLIRKNRSLLMMGPLIAVGLNGLTESTLYMSILAGHLALAGAIFMNIDEKLKT